MYTYRPLSAYLAAQLGPGSIFDVPADRAADRGPAPAVGPHLQRLVGERLLTCAGAGVDGCGVAGRTDQFQESRRDVRPSGLKTGAKRMISAMREPPGPLVCM